MCSELVLETVELVEGVLVCDLHYLITAVSLKKYKG